MSQASLDEVPLHSCRQHLSRPVLAILMATLAGPFAPGSDPPGTVPTEVPAKACKGVDAPKQPKDRQKAKEKKARNKRNRQARTAGGVGKVQELRGYQIKPGVSLKGANFNGADLGGIDWTGVSLEGASVFGAKTFGARNLDLRGARNHPFFQRTGRERLGDLKFLALPQDQTQADVLPRSLTCSPDGLLFWIAGQSNTFKLVTPTGNFCMTTPLGDDLHALRIDPFNRLWCFGAKAYYATDLGEFSCGQGLGVSTYPHRFRERPEGVIFGQDGTLIAQMKSEIGYLSPKDKERPGHGGYAAVALPRSVKAGDFSLACDPQDKHIFFAYADRDQIVVSNGSGSERLEHDFQSGSRPQCPAQGADGSVWFLLPGADALVRFPDPQRKEVYPIPAESGLVRRGLAGLAMGPDGSMWFTQKDAGRIGRMTITGGRAKIQELALPRGFRPMEIIGPSQGRMYFTLEGKPFIGSVQAEEEEGTAAESFNVVIPERKQERKSKYPSARERRLQEAELRARQRLACAEPDPEPGEAWFWKTEAVMVALEEKKARREAKETKDAGEPVRPDPMQAKAWNPVEALAEVDAALPDSALNHIKERHGHDRVGFRHKSRFGPDFRSDDQLRALIGRRLPEVWAREKEYIFDDLGRSVTYCWQEGVGDFNFHGTLLPAEWFRVVTEEVSTEDGVRHDVVTAYPVSEDE